MVTLQWNESCTKWNESLVSRFDLLFPLFVVGKAYEMNSFQESGRPAEYTCSPFLPLLWIQQWIQPNPAMNSLLLSLFTSLRRVWICAASYDGNRSNAIVTLGSASSCYDNGPANCHCYDTVSLLLLWYNGTLPLLHCSIACYDTMAHCHCSIAPLELCHCSSYNSESMQ